MNPAQALDEHRVSYYRSVADFALMVARGADLPALMERADYLCNPRLAALVPELSSITPQFTADELVTMAIAAEECTSVRGLLTKLVARHCLRADVLECVANYYDRARASFWDRRRADLSLSRRLTC